MNRRVIKDKTAQYGSAFLLGVSVCVIVALLVGLICKASPLIQEEGLLRVLSDVVWSPQKGRFGFLPFIMGTLWVTAIALLIAVPLCVLASLYLVEYADAALRAMVLPLINILAAIPPVLYGVWGVLMVVPAIGNYVAPLFGVATTGYSIFAGGIVLAVMIFPIMMSVMVAVLQTIPADLRAASLSLGATRWETLRKVVLVKARPGLLAAVILGVSRAFGETVAVLMVCGNIPQIPKAIFDSGYPLPALIANNFGEMMSIPRYDSALMFAALLLFVIILSFNLLARMVLNKLEGAN